MTIKLLMIFHTDIFLINSFGRAEMKYDQNIRTEKSASEFPVPLIYTMYVTLAIC